MTIYPPYTRYSNRQTRKPDKFRDKYYFGFVFIGKAFSHSERIGKGFSMLLFIQFGAGLIPFSCSFPWWLYEITSLWLHHFRKKFTTYYLQIMNDDGEEFRFCKIIIPGKKWSCSKFQLTISSILLFLLMKY